jgi:predicted RecB family nuclease
MVKQINDANRLRYKKNLADFMASINPKPPIEVLERLLERYEEERTAHETNKITNH